MRRGLKRKTIQKDDDHKEFCKAASSRAKRVKASKPDPEYFEDRRSLEDLWKEAFPVGTEWDMLGSVYEYKWDFSNLENAFEEGGKFYGQKVYLFGCTEPQLVPFKGHGVVVHVPSVVAVVSPFPPSDKIGVKSVQRVVEEIVPMKQMKMDWVPYIPLEDRDGQVDRLKSQIYVLSCTQRRVALKNLKIERVKKHDYCLPYFCHPFKESDLEKSTEVPILYPAEPKPVISVYDWGEEEENIEDLATELIEDGKLTEDQKDAFMEFVEEQVREAQAAVTEAREARERSIEEMTDETRAAYETMKFYKFYPLRTPDTPDVSKVKATFINRYYWHAHEVL